MPISENKLLRLKSEESLNEGNRVMKKNLTTEEVAKSLQKADILLTHGRGPVSSLIRFGTRSHWNHAVIVFVLSDEASGKPRGYQRTFIIEAQAHGIDIHPIDKYLKKEKQDMAILRLPEDVVPASIREDFLRRVRGFALEEIDAGYGFPAIGNIIKRLLGRIARPLAFIAGSVKLLFRTPGVSEVVNRWICSGIVQYAYYRACFGAKPASGDIWDPYFADRSNRAKVVVNSDLRLAIEGDLSYDDATARLKLTTPAHFALAATYGQLYTVAQRVDGRWSDQLTHT